MAATADDRADDSLPFRSSTPFTVGIELELGIVDPADMDLAPGAQILVAALARDGFARHVRAEITSAMIELNSSVHSDVTGLHDEIRHLMSTLVAYAHRFGLGIIGGGTHPFQEWAHREIYPATRFRSVSRDYGYMAKQFTVFGQHVHIGCASGDDAVYLTHALTRYAPHLIALAAASPFWRGVDTGFECCRLNVVNAFPTSGVAPRVKSWAEFERFYREVRRRNIVSSIKDFYWDVRPKPEFGTVEVRVCDSPLRVVDAIDIAALVQALAAELLAVPRQWGDEYDTWTYARNRFQAARHGLAGEFIDSADGKVLNLRESLAGILERIGDRFGEFGASVAHSRLLGRVHGPAPGAAWLRDRYRSGKDFRAVVRDMSEMLLETG
jgi:carboxylate-amine ligase